MPMGRAALDRRALGSAAESVQTPQPLVGALCVELTRYHRYIVYMHASYNICTTPRIYWRRACPTINTTVSE